MPLAHEGAELVGCEVQAVEVGETVLALDFVDAELHLAESVIFVVLEIGERDLEDTALQGVVGVLQTGGSVDEGFSNTFRQLVFVRLFTKSRSQQGAYSRIWKVEGAYLQLDVGPIQSHSS